MLSIASSARDKVLYADTNNFRFELGTTLRNVKEIRPVTVVVPKAQYTVDEYNDVIDVAYTANPSQAVDLTHGNYTVAQFVSHLNARLDADATTGAVWTVVDNASSGGPATFTISNTGSAFSFPFLTGTNSTRSDASLLGFVRKIDSDTATGGGPYTITGPQVYDLGGPRNVVIKIEANGYNLGNIYTGGVFGSVFAVVPLNVLFGEVKYHEVSSDHAMFTPLTGKESVSYFDVKVYDESSGKPYLLHGAEISIIAQVLTPHREIR